MNALSFVALARLGAKPLEPFGKGSNALKAGTPDAGPEGPTVPGAFGADTAVRSAPGRDRAEGGLIRAAGEERQGYVALLPRAAPARLRLRSLDRTGIGVSFAPFTGAGYMAVAFVFPGQGSQTVGMGRGLAEVFASARRVF